MGCDIITGGEPGPMAAANEGATCADANARNRSVGIRVQLPFEQDVNAFVSQAYEHRTFFTRLHQFVLMSDAFVVMPGGIGSVLEGNDDLATPSGRAPPGHPPDFGRKMYAELVAWCQRHMLQLKLHLANPDDIALPRCAMDQGS